MVYPEKASIELRENSIDMVLGQNLKPSCQTFDYNSKAKL